ncbi:MAG: hypothetical protein H0W83_06490 [Planctomycetes bacterium]|nr:hypothetical protein [Planctomycetota bacterium]
MALVDIDPAALRVAERLARKMIAGRSSRLRLSATTDRRAALPGATAVIGTIAVGGRRAWEADVFIPRTHGVFQPVGDTVMAGGASRALRMIPAMVAIARDVLELAPTALFFNYANPMGPICRAVRKATGAHMIGLCHGVNHVASYLASALACAQERFAYSAVGLNHLTWFVEAAVDGADAAPRLRAIADERARTDDQPFSWNLCRLFGAFPSACDRHVVEFFPHLVPGGEYRGKRLGIDAFSFEGTIAGGDAGYAEMTALANDPAPLPESFFAAFGGEHEQVVQIIADIRGDRRSVYSANMPNRGQVRGLPEDAILESPCVTDGATLRPIAQAPLSPGIIATIAKQLAWTECVVDAALTGDRALFIQALALDGTLPSLDAAAALADDLLRAQAAHLPQFTTAAPETAALAAR